MTETNLFILLELDPNKPWDQAEFERQLQSKRQEWSRLLNSPTPKGIQAKQNLGQISEFQKVAGDEARRQVQATEARQLREKNQAGKLKEFEDKLQLLQIKGHILTEEFERLVKDFGDILSEKEIRKRLNVPIEQEQAASWSSQAALDPVKAKYIQQKLQGLDKVDLYDFLGMGQATESSLLLKQAQDFYDSVQKKAAKTPQDTLKSELSGECLVIFKSEPERAKYNETLRLQEYDKLKKKIDVMGEISKQIDQKQLEQLLREAKAKGFNLDEAQAIILEYVRKKGYAVFVSGQIQAVRELSRCGYCGNLNEKNKKHCTQCGELLSEACPRCNKMVASDEIACGQCGFPTGNRSWVKVLLNDVQQAHRTRDYDAALAFLEQANRAWPASVGSTQALAREIKEMEAKIGPDKKARDELLNQIETALQQKRFYAARSLVPHLDQVLPVASQKVGEYRRQIEDKIHQAEAKLSQARRSEQSESEKAVQIYQEALQICQDCQEARERLAKTPPSPPGRLQATVSDKVIHLTWQPSPSQGVRYTVVRKNHARPISVNDGEKLSTATGTVYDDPTAEIGVPLFYAVFADREGVPSTNGVILTQPVMKLREVGQLTARVDNQQVHLRWTPPPNVQDIVVVRSGTGYPTALPDGQLVPVVDKSQAIDRKVQNEHRYFYTVFCQFKDYEGKLQTTSGVQIEATPQQPPTPIQELQIVTANSGQTHQVQLRWPPPPKGEVVILKSERSTGLQFGAIIPQQELAKYGQVLVATSNQVSDKIGQLGFYYFLPVVLFHGVAYVGQEHKYVCIDDVSQLSVQNLGHVLRLQWQWPPNCQEVLVAYSYQGWPQINQTETITVPLTRAQYDLHGYYDISNPVQADHYITVFAVMNQEGQKITASGENKSARKRVGLISRITLGYEIKKCWFAKKFSLHLTIKGQGTLPILILTRKQKTLPMTKFDGEIIFRLEATTIQNEHLNLALPEEAEHRQSYGKLFLENDDLYDVVTIRHPAPEKLRLF